LELLNGEFVVLVNVESVKNAADVSPKVLLLDGVAKVGE
jgi:hypothetical protein